MAGTGLDRRDFLKALGAGTAALGLGACAGPAGVAPGRGKRKDLPNFVVIFTDDQGWADVGVFGAEGFETPNLDRMAAEGMKFTTFYVPQGVCSASRAGLLTGCYPKRVGIAAALMPWSKIGLNPKEVTIAEMLKPRGYVSGIFGKWHLGSRKKFLPLQQGFDEYFGLPYSNDMWPVDYDGRHLTKENPGKKPWKLRYPELPLIEGNEKVGEIRTLEDQAKLTTLYTEHAVRFIEKHKDRPFFLYLAHSMPHVPLGVSKKFKGKSKQGMYGDVIMEIDWSVGQVLETLKRCGLDEKTLVIFTSDNGPWLNFGNWAGSAGPLREGKGTIWDGGVREPCIMRWPGKIPAGTVCDKMASTIDLFPTFAFLAGAKLPDHKIDGVNIWPLMAGVPGAEPRKEYAFYYPTRRGWQLQAVRKGKWKLHFPHPYRSYEGMPRGRDGWPGPTKTRRTPLVLYDMEADIRERVDLSKKYPRVVEELKALGEKFREDLGDIGRKGKGCRPPGRI